MSKTVALTDIHDNPGPNYPVPDFPDAFMYTLHVDRVERGNVAGDIRVLEGNDSGRATFDWVPGTAYLLFLFSSSQQKDTWALDGCGNSGPVSKAGVALSQIAAAKTARDGGIIQGVVRGSEEVPEVAIAGARVEAKGQTGRYLATTNGRGEFKIDVPAGRYTVDVVDQRRLFDMATFSYDDPVQIQVQPGRCAQIEFAEVGSRPAQ